MLSEPIRFGDLAYRVGDPMFVCADVGCMKKATTWRPAYPVESGLRQNVDRWWESLNANF